MGRSEEREESVIFGCCCVVREWKKEMRKILKEVKARERNYQLHKTR